MATSENTSNVIGTLPLDATTLDAREYLDFLKMIEGGLPEGTRCYLVTLDDDGKRHMQPVKDGSSIVNLRENLTSHLNAAMWFGKEETKKLFDYCAGRLRERGVDLTPLEVQQAGIVLEQCAMLAKSIAQLAVDGTMKDDDAIVEHELRCIKQLAQQLGYQADLGAEKIGIFASVAKDSSQCVGQLKVNPHSVLTQ